MYNFTVDKDYTKKDMYKIIGISENTKGGNWDTGYNFYKDDLFIFSNIGVAGRTGHRYNNNFDGEYFHWYAKNHTKLTQPQIQKILNPPSYVYIFYRTDSTKPFTFAGTGIPYSHQDVSPVQITWKINNGFDEIQTSKSENDKLCEGLKKQIFSNVYERNPEARKRCVEHHGYNCFICDFDFVKKYGVLGKDFIHVHHIKPLSEINRGYYVDPINDLRPVCPNCHAMLHRKTPAVHVEDLKKQLKLK